MGNISVDSGGLPFSDASHLANHLNYLFRTDKNQKWTNELTNQNIVCIFDGDATPIPFSDDLNSRKKVMERAKALCKNHDIGLLQMMRCEYADNNIYVFDDGMYDDLVNIIKTMRDANGITLLLLVTHCDQKQLYTHFHIVYENKTDKALPEILGWQ